MLFLVMNIAAASIDGFISGFAVASMGTNFGFREFVKSFCIIFLCCFSAAFCGRNLAVVCNERYINLTGRLFMLYLAYRAFPSPDKEKYSCSRITAVSVSVAADAAIVCIYLAMEGYPVAVVCLRSAISHSVLMMAGVKLAHCVIKEAWELYTAYISSFVFLCMAIYKLAEM